MKVLIFSGLFLGFLLLFQQMELLRKMEKFWQKTRGDMEASARLRVLEERQHIREFQRKYSFWWKMDRNLKYSGLSGKYPRLTAEWWIVGNLLVAAQPQIRVRYHLEISSIFFGFHVKMIHFHTRILNF